MIIEFDCEAVMRDNTVIRYDVYRPDKEGQYPCITTYGPYSKGMHFSQGYSLFWHNIKEKYPEILKGTSGKYMNWETVDPEKWIPEGYAIAKIDSRGCGRSESRKHNNITSEYAFKGRIICAVCGSKYKRKMCRNKAFWICRKHDNLADSCDSKRLEERSIVEAFLRLSNKLQLNYKHILLPLQIALQDLKLRKFCGNSNVMEIHKEIAKLKEQTHVLARLKTKGFLDNAKYLEQIAVLNTKVKKLQSELKKITHLDNEDETLDQIEMLIDYFEKQSDPITEFDESAFEFLVEKIVVISQNELEFHVIGGLKFTEKIC